MDPKISPSFWSDPDLVSLPHDQQPWVRYSVLWMITNPDTNMAGIFRIAPRLYEFQTGLEAAWLERTLLAAPRMFIRDGEAVLIRNFVRYQFGVGTRLLSNRNMVTAILKALQRASQGLTKPFLATYPELEALWRAYQALPEPINTGLPSTSVPSGNPSQNEGLTKGLPSPQIRSEYVQSRSEGECEGGNPPHIPSEAEVIAHGQGPTGIPVEYCRDYHRWRTNTRAWLNRRNELILWQKDLLERWVNARATWKPHKTSGPGGSETSADLESQLQTETNPEKRRQLRNRLKNTPLSP